MPLSDLETGLGIRLALSATTQRIFVFQGEIVSMLSTDRWAAAKWPPSGLPASLPGPVARDRGRRRRLGSFVCRPKQNRRDGQQENFPNQRQRHTVRLLCDPWVLAALQAGAAVVHRR